MASARDRQKRIYEAPAVLRLSSAAGQAAPCDRSGSHAADYCSGDGSSAAGAGCGHNGNSAGALGCFGYGNTPTAGGCNAGSIP